jgi:microcystin-dependent protein
MVGFNFAPVGWFQCSGQLLSIAEYDTLFALIGTIYGGDGQTTFALPDLRGRMPISKGQGPGLSSYVIGQAAGTETVTLISTQIPSHTHALTQTVSHPCQSGAGNSNVPTGRFFAADATGENYASTSNAAMGAIAFSTTVGAAGGNQPHNNLSPSLCVNFIIAAFGIFPSRN